MISGMQASWIGVGDERRMALSAETSHGSRPADLKVGLEADMLRGVGNATGRVQRVAVRFFGAWRGLIGLIRMGDHSGSEEVCGRSTCTCPTF